MIVIWACLFFCCSPALVAQPSCAEHAIPCLWNCSLNNTLRLSILPLHSPTALVIMYRVGQNRVYTPYMTVALMISLPKIPYIHRIYMVLANPNYVHRFLLPSFPALDVPPLCVFFNWRSYFALLLSAAQLCGTLVRAWHRVRELMSEKWMMPWFVKGKDFQYTRWQLCRGCVT
jgi:hypothetical protein